MGLDPNLAIMTSGVATMIFLLATRGRVPSYLGCSLSFVGVAAVIRAQGAEVVIGGARYADAQEACDRYVAETGALRVHPFSAEPTIAGQGTVALEWEEDGPPLDTVLVAVGGGGLISGIASWWAGRVRVVGVEPEGSRALHAALEADAPVDVEVASVAADSLGARNVGPLVHAICRDTVSDVVLVSDGAIRAAQASASARPSPDDAPVISTPPHGYTPIACPPPQPGGQTGA